MTYRDELEAARARIAMLEDEIERLRSGRSAKSPARSDIALMRGELKNLRERNARLEKQNRRLRAEQGPRLAVEQARKCAAELAREVPSWFTSASIEEQVSALVADADLEGRLIEAEAEIQRLRALGRRVLTALQKLA